MDRIAKDGISRVFGNPMADPDKNEFLNDLRRELEERPKVDRVFIHMVFMGEADKVNSSRGLDIRRENIENKRHLVQEFFSNPEVELIVEFICHNRPPPPTPVSDIGTIALARHSSLQTSDGVTMFVGFVPLMDLYRIWERLKGRFLSRNLRFGLSAEKHPNRKIREALADIVIKQSLSPELFPFNHNGVALAAERVALNDGKATLTVPRLLNGAQTITSVAKFLEDNSQNPALKENEAKLGGIQVLAKIIEYDPTSDFVTNVTICNNCQNRVEPWDLRANDRIQCDLQDKFREEANVFYSRQERAFQNYSEEELEGMGVDPGHDMRIEPLARTLLAVQGEIGYMSKLPYIFENQDRYAKTFRSSYLEVDASRIVLVYKVYKAIRSPTEHLRERMGRKWSTPVQRAKNLVCALLIQGLLNDPKLKDHLDAFAEDLAVQWEFREYLRDLAVGKVCMILRHILTHKDFAEPVTKGKTRFPAHQRDI